MPLSSGKKVRGAGLEPVTKEEGIERVQSYLDWAAGKEKDNKDIHPIHCNAMGNLHGGCTSTIFDVLTSMVLHLVAREGFWQYLGVSRTLNCTYVRPAPLGTTVDIECDILQIGKSLCTLRGIMRAVGENGELGAVLSACEHGKVTIDPPAGKL